MRRVVAMNDVGGMLQCRANGALLRQHGASSDKRQERVLNIAHMLLAMVNPSTLGERIPVVARDATFAFDVAEDDKRRLASSDDRGGMLGSRS